MEFNSAKEKLTVQVVTPEKEVFAAEDVLSVFVNSDLGTLTILPGQTPLVANLVVGELEIKTIAQTSIFAITDGVLKVDQKSKITLLVDQAISPEEVDVAAAEEARKRAEEYLAQQENMADIEYAKIEAEIQKELAKIAVAKYRRSTKPTT